MHFSFRYSRWSSAALTGALALAACQTPGEGLPQGSEVTGDAASTVDGSGSPTTTASSSTTGTASTDVGVTSNTVGSSTSDSTSATADTTTATSSDGAGGSTTSSNTSDTAATSDTSSTTGGSTSNVINNGDFQTDSAACEIDDSDWFTEGTFNWSGVDDTICSYCIVLEAEQSGQLNWSGNSGTPPTLQAGQSYQFSLEVYSNEGTPPSLTAKVGQPVEPYDAFLEQEVSVPSSSSTQSFSFTMNNTDQVGIAFFVSAGADWGKICFDNISIEPQ